MQLFRHRTVTSGSVALDRVRQTVLIRRLHSKPPGGLVAAALWVVGGVDGERDPIELYGGGDEGLVRREVVAIAHAVKCGGRAPTQANPGLEWATVTSEASRIVQLT